MSDSDFGSIDESIKKHHRKKSKHSDDKPKKRKRSKSLERNVIEKNYKDKKKQKSDKDERDYKSSDSKFRKNNPDRPIQEEKSRERKRKSSPVEESMLVKGRPVHEEKGRERKRKSSPLEESILEKESNSSKRNESKIKENKKEKTESKKMRDNAKESKERRKDLNYTDEDKNKSGSKSKEYEETYKKKRSSRIEEYDKDLSQKKISSKFKNSDDERHKKSNPRYEKSWDIDGKKSSSRRNAVTDENDYYNDRLSSHDQSDEDEDKNRNSNEKPQRYWSNPRPIRENNDKYWNKYNDRFKKSPENVEVGPRYYSTSEKSKRDLKETEEGNDKRRGDDNNAKQKDNQNGENEVEKSVPPKRKTFDLLTSRTGGAYIPPAKLKMMQESITDKGSAEFQRLAWEALKKSIQGHVNKVNVSNIIGVIKAIQKENIVRGKGLLCRALIQAQAASPTFTNVYAALVAVLNARFPKIGELLLKRLVVQFRRGFKRNDKTICITAATFIAHLVNQEVAHEILALEILTLLIETPTDDSVEVAIAFLKECGMKLSEVASKGVMGIFDMLRNILHEGKLEKRVQYMIEVMFQIRKEDFKAHPSLIDGLDLVEQEDKITHLISLEENHNPEDILNVFKFDPDYEASEARYKALVQDDDDDDGSGGESSGSDDSDDESEEDAEEGKEKQDVIVDKTETNLVALRKTIYLTIQSSLDFEECAHKLLRMELKPGQEIEMAHMFLDCCAEQRTYEKFYGLLSQRFCQINRSYIGPFEETFRDSYSTIHRMSNDKLRNIAKLFAHLLYTDAISWEVLSTIRLNEDDTTSSSRIFIKILFQELSEYMGLANLNQRVKDPALQSALEGLFPRDNPQHTRFAINFFTSIGLGGITDELREHLKSMPKPTVAVNQLVAQLSSSSDSSSSDSSSDSSDSSSDSSSSSDSDDNSKKKKKKKK